MTKSDEATKASWHPRTPAEFEEVRRQLELLLHDPLFNQSRRYPSLLRRIVEESLEGRTDNLKERILGMEIFDRPADYDTNADAIVRVTAAEIRKRIAQYYHHPKHFSEIRIDLPVGGYVAVFQLASQAPAPVSSVLPVVEPKVLTAELPPLLPAIAPPQIAARAALPYKWITAALLVLLALLGAWVWLRPADSFKTFWNPLARSPSPTVICVGQLPLQFLQNQAPSDHLGLLLLAQKPVSISDAIVVSNFATFLGAQGVKPKILVSTQTSLSDLRNTPVLLVGGLDNAWTMRMLSGLRYRMRSEPGSPALARIYNADKPEEGQWFLNFEATANTVGEDYAIVARFTDRETENTVLIAAGLGENGTSAAAEFLTHPQYLKTLGEGAPKGWETKDVEAVVRTRLIEGKAGPAEVVAKYYW